VRAEAANALARHGPELALKPLLELYEKDSHWLVRSSILAALADEKGVPAEVLLELAEKAMADADPTLQESGKQLRLKLQRERFERLLG
jgi:HEAT repeat protein